MCQQAKLVFSLQYSKISCKDFVRMELNRDEFGPGPAWPGPGLSKAIFGVWPTMGLGRIILAQAWPSLRIGKLERPIGPNCGPWAKFF